MMIVLSNNIIHGRQPMPLEKLPLDLICPLHVILN
ncbi:unnamed protein product [Musa acuminata var. zebrina]